MQSQRPPEPAPATGDSTWQLPADVTTLRSKLVYLYLWSARRADVTEISRAVREPQLRIYPALECLVQHGHVVRDGTTFTFAGGKPATAS